MKLKVLARLGIPVNGQMRRCNPGAIINSDDFKLTEKTIKQMVEAGQVITEDMAAEQEEVERQKREAAAALDRQRLAAGAGPQDPAGGNAARTEEVAMVRTYSDEQLLSTDEQGLQTLVAAHWPGNDAFLQEGADTMRSRLAGLQKAAD